MISRETHLGWYGGGFLSKTAGLRRGRVRPLRRGLAGGEEVTGLSVVLLGRQLGNKVRELVILLLQE